MQPVSPAEFEEYVADALDELPPELAARFDNVVVVVEGVRDVVLELRRRHRLHA